MKKSPAPLFLAQDNYRYRRLTDAARFLPLLGLVLFFLPLMWHEPSTAAGLVYLFSVWLFLILCAAWLSFRLAKGAGDGAQDDGRGEGIVPGPGGA